MKFLSGLLLKILIIFTITLKLITSTKEIKNILVYSFPGGKSHSFIFRELFDYTQARMREENPNFEIKFKIIIHNYDMELWENSPYDLIGYGDKHAYEDKFQKALEMVREDPVFGYNNFNKALINLNNDFLKDNIIEKLKGVKYDLFITDVVSMIAPFLRQALDIKKSMAMNPTCVFVWINGAFEYNAAYHPLIGTTYTELMTFSERFINQVSLWGTRLSYQFFKYSQLGIFREYGYDFEIEPFPTNILFLNQCVDGVHYSYSLPPNIINTGAILPKPSKEIENETILDFLNKFNSNIYVSQGTIFKVLDTDVMFEVFESFPEIGFILSIKKELIDSVETYPKNLLILDWAPQNDLLGHHKVKVFITHGGLNSILESLYHAKPMIVVGTSIDQVNGAVVVDYRKLGKGIMKNSDLTKENLIAYISELLSNQVYTDNCKFAQKLVKEKSGKETFYYWLNYTLEYGYEHLLIPAYSDYNFLELHNVDIIFILVCIIALLFYLVFCSLKKLYMKIYTKIISVSGKKKTD